MSEEEIKNSQLFVELVIDTAKKLGMTPEEVKLLSEKAAFRGEKR